MLNMFVHNINIHNHATRNRHKPHVCARNTSFISKSIRHLGPKIWYNLPLNIIEANSSGSFKNRLKKYIISEYSL